VTRFKTWNIFDSALFSNAYGHHYWETKALAEELVRRGETVRLFSHVKAPTQTQFPGAEIIPVFSLYLYANVSDDRTFSLLENFVVHNRAFCQDLSTLDPSLFRDGLVLFPTVGHNQLLGIVRWLGRFAEASTPQAALGLFPPWDWSKTSHAAGLYRTVWKQCPPALKTRIAAFARTPQMAQMFATHIGIDAQVFPYPIAPDLETSKPEMDQHAGGEMVVAFVGGARRERGGELIADVVRQCREPGVRFVIQARHEGDSDMDKQALPAVSGLPHVRLHEGPLERSEYYRTIAGSVMLLPYEADSYRWRDSGVFHEARYLDAPVLVSAGTWMAEDVTSGGNGLVIPEHSPAAIVDVIAKAKRDLPALRAAAMRVGREYRERNGVARCIDAIAAAAAGNSGN